MRPPTFDHLLSEKKPVTKRVPIALDPDLAADLEDAQRHRDVCAARSGARPTDSEAASQHWEAEAAVAALVERFEAEDLIAWFTFRGIGRVAVEKLVDEHPPTADQRIKGKAQGVAELTWNTETFPAFIVSASLVEPKLTVEQVQALWADENWNQAELQVLLNAAIEVNGTRRTVHLGKDSRRTGSSAQKSPTA